MSGNIDISWLIKQGFQMDDNGIWARPNAKSGKSSKKAVKTPTSALSDDLGASKSGIYTFDVVPMGKPSFQKSDKFRTKDHPNPRMRQRPNVGRWIEFKKELVEQAKKQEFIMPASGIDIRFKIPMPSSWSQKRKDRMNNMPHQQRPDTDNICKAIFDSLCEEDGYIYHYTVGKWWGKEGKIIISIE